MRRRKLRHRCTSAIRFPGVPPRLGYTRHCEGSPAGLRCRWDTVGPGGPGDAAAPGGGAGLDRGADGAAVRVVAEPNRARELAETMVALGTAHGVRTLALLTDMNTPLGRTAGNALEVAEAVEVLAAKAPTLREALDRAVEQGFPYLILDGTLISCDRCADKKTSKKGKEIDKWHSGKAHEPAGNVQALAAPGGVPLWVSDVLPGSTHDLTAARELVLPEARPYLKDLPILADSGYEGAGAGVHVPVKKPARSELDTDPRTRNALLRSLRYQGERGFALMSQRWRVLQHVMVSPSTIGDIAKAALVLVQFEQKMIS